jgi:hypothetical protein
VGKPVGFFDAEGDVLVAKVGVGEVGEARRSLIHRPIIQNTTLLTRRGDLPLLAGYQTITDFRVTMLR